MKNVKKIIELLGGDAFQHITIKHDSPSMMRLAIERIGTFGPNNLPLFSVAHYYEQNGDLMADPEMTFVQDVLGKWHPISFRNDGVGCYQEGEAGAMGFNEDGKAWTRPRLIRDLRAFSNQWDRNLKEQGYIAAAKKLANTKAIIGG